LVVGVPLGPLGDFMKSGSDAGSYDEEIKAWRKSRIHDLTSEDGWLALAGLFWLQPGKNTIGGSTASDIVLPGGNAPDYAASILVANGTITIEASPEAGITCDGNPVRKLELHSDEGGKPTVLKLGSLSFHLIKRGDQLGLRVKARDNPDRVG